MSIALNQDQLQGKLADLRERLAALELPPGLDDSRREEAAMHLRGLQQGDGGRRLKAKVWLLGNGIFSAEELGIEETSEEPGGEAGGRPGIFPLSQGNPRENRIVHGPPPEAARDLEAEQAVLAGLIHHGRAAAEALESLVIEDFDGAAQRQIFAAIEDALEGRKKPSPLLIRARLLRDPAAARCGALEALEVVRRLNPLELDVLVEYATLLHEIGSKRREARARKALARAALDDGLRNGTLQAEASDLLAEIAANDTSHPSRDRDIEDRLRPWPAPAEEAALHGVAGEVVRALDPVTEADPMAILGQFLVAFGNMAGRNPCWFHEETRHGLNLFLVVVGPSSTGGKGTSLKNALRVLDGCDEKKWKPTTGLISGEGLIHSVRNPSLVIDPEEKQLAFAGMVDRGVDDKRVLFVETEFNSVLTAKGRQGNTLPDQLRKAWDGDPLGIASRNNAIGASGHHVSIIGHITFEELDRRFSRIDKANGLGNRFLWLCARQSKSIPASVQGKRIDWEANGVRGRIKAALAFAQAERKQDLILTRDAAASKLWDEVTPVLNNHGSGPVGAMRARAKPIVLRLAAVYAVLDCSTRIRVEHLRAALAFWAYCERSVTFIFGSEEASKDPALDRTYQLIRESGSEGMTLTQVGRKLFIRDQARAVVVLNQLLREGLIRSCSEPTKGRPRTVFRAVSERE